jgi:Acyl-CoA dehydrogenase, C-terminal domain
VTFVQDTNDLFLASAQDALRSAPGDDALAILGWSELLGSIEDDTDARLGVFAFFRAQGRELGSSAALGQLMAQPYAQVFGRDQSTIAAVQRRSGRRGDRAVLVGTLGSSPIIVDRPGLGVSLVELESLELKPIGLSDGLALCEVQSDLTGLPLALGESAAVALRARSIRLGRIALAFEILGAAEAALAGAVQHSRDREQFGHPLGHFQAVRHLLATARVDTAAIEALAKQSVELYPVVPLMRDAVLKAVAGRNGRRVCERSLQVLGAIGFTVEHGHHRFHSRVLILDTLLGSSNSLAHLIAVNLRESAGTVPDLTTPVDTIQTAQ